MGIFSPKNKSEIERLTEENDELKNTLHTVLQKHTSHMELENKIAQAKKELKDVTDKKIKFDNDINQLNNDISEKSETIITLEHKINTLETEKSNIDQLVKSYDTDKLVADAKAQENIIEQTKEEGQKLASHLDKLSAEEIKKQNHLEELTEKISLNDEIKSNLERTLAGLVSSIEEKDKQYTEFLKKEQDLMSRVFNKQTEIGKIEQILTSQTIQLESITDQITSTDAKKKKLEDEISRIEQIKNELNEDILIHKEKEDELKSKIEKTQQFVDTLEKRKTVVEESNIKVENIFSETISNFTEEIDQAKSKLHELKKEIYEKEKTLIQKEKILLEKSFHIAEYGGLNKVLQKERAAAELIIKELREEERELSNSVNALKDKENEHKIAVHDLQHQTDSLNKKKADLEKQLRDVLNDVSSNYSKSEENKNRLLEEINEKNLILDKLKDSINTARSELRSIKEEASQMEIKKEEVSSKVTELISLEKNMKFKIEQKRKDQNGENGNTEIKYGNPE